MIPQNKLNQPTSRFIKYFRAFLKLFMVLLILAASSCQKDSVSDFGEIKTKKTVVDYILNLEGLYLIKYNFQYNEKYQVTKVYRGERFANLNQLQLILESHYNANNNNNLPDSISTYNTKGFKVGVLKPDDYNKVVSISKNQSYKWPERENKLLAVPGGEFALAISSKKVAWSGAGHLGSGSQVEIMHNLNMLNRHSLKDSLQVPVPYKTDGTDRKFDDFRILYNNSGYPIDLAFFDAINANFEKLKINYREE